MRFLQLKFRTKATAFHPIFSFSLLFQSVYFTYGFLWFSLSYSKFCWEAQFIFSRNKIWGTFNQHHMFSRKKISRYYWNGAATKKRTDSSWRNVIVKDEILLKKEWLPNVREVLKRKKFNFIKPRSLYNSLL